MAGAQALGPGFPALSWSLAGRLLRAPGKGPLAGRYVQLVSVQWAWAGIPLCLLGVLALQPCFQSLRSKMVTSPPHRVVGRLVL